MSVADMSLGEIVDKNMDQEQLVKDLIAKYIAGRIDQLEADIASGKIDPIPGTNIDNKMLASAVAVVKAALGL